MATVLDIETTVRLTATSCCVCGVAFGLPDAMLAKRREDGKDFYCPNGHVLVFSGPTEAEKLKTQLAQVRARLDQAEANVRDERLYRKREVAAQKGKLTKFKNRVANGVCPCCDRHFKDLDQHMHMQHPDYKRGEGDDSEWV